MRMTRVSLMGVCLLLLMQVNSLQAELPEEDPFSGYSSVDNISGGMQLGGNGGYLIFRKVVGDGAFFEDSFQTFGAFAPIFRWDDGEDHGLLFSNLKLMLTDHRQIGTNASVGLRLLGNDQIFGGSFTFDTDDSANGNRFNQVSFGVEYLRREFDLRANAYIPVNNSSQQFAPISIAPNPIFQEHRILFPAVALFENAMEGADAEVAIPLFGLDWLKAAAGAYYYNAENEDDPVGVRGRLSARLSDDTIIDFALTEDRIAGTNLNLFVTLLFSGDPRYRLFPRRRMFERMYEQIERNDRVAIQTFKDEVDNVLAYDPRDNTPYFVDHVDNTNADPGDGTFENPFNTLPTVARPEADIILVRTGTGTVFQMDQGIVLSDYQRLLGEGLAHQFDATANLMGLHLAGTFVLPGLTDTFDFPDITNINGDAVTLASFNEVSAFDIPSALGNGIAGNGITNFNINNVNVSLSGGGIVLNNAAGTGTIMNYNSTTNAAGGIVINNTNTSTLNLSLLPFVTVNGGDVGVSLTANNSRINANVDTLQATLTGDGLELIANNGGRIDANVTDSTINGATGAGLASGHGVSVMGDAGTVNLMMTDNTVIQSAMNGLNVNLQNGAAFTGDIQGTTFSNSLNHGIQVTMGGSSTGSLSLDTTLVNGVGADGLNAVLMSGSDLVVDIADSSFVGAGQDAFDLSAAGAGTTLDFTMTTTPATGAGMHGFSYNLDTAAVMTATISNSDFSDAGINAFFGTGANGAQANLTIFDTPGDDPGGSGFVFDFDTSSSINALVMASSFNSAGQFGIQGTMDNNATGNVTFLSTPADDAGIDGMHLELMNGANLVATVTNGSFNNPGDDGIEAIVDDATLDITVDPTPALNAGDNGFVFDLDNAAVVTADFDFTPADNAGSNGLLITADNASTFTGTFDNASFNSAGLTTAGNAVQVVVDNGSLVDLALNLTPGIGSGGNGLSVEAAGGATFLGVVTDGSFADSGQDPASSPMTDRNAIFLDANAATIDLTLVNTPGNNTPGNMTQENGILFNAAAGGTLLVDVTDGTFSDNLTNAIQGTVTGMGTLAMMSFTGTPSDNSGEDGVNIMVSGGGALDFSYDSSSISNSQGNGVFATIAGAGSTADFDFNGTIIDDNGQDPLQGGDGVNANPSGGGAVTANFTGGSVSGNREQGVDVDVMDVSMATFNFSNTSVDGNLEGEGLSFDVTGGGTFLSSIFGGSFSNNGVNIPADGIRGSVSGAGSSGDITITGATVDNNTVNGINLAVNMGAMLTAAVDGGTSASNHPNGSGLKLDADDAGTVAILTSADSNQFNNNGSTSGSDGVDVDADNVMELTAIVSGSASFNGADGVNITANNVGMATIGVNGTSAFVDSIMMNADQGVSINLTDIPDVTDLTISNLNINNNPAEGIFISLDNAIVNGGGINNSNVDNNGNSGALVTMVNASTYVASIPTNTFNDNGDYGFRLTADSGVVDVDFGGPMAADGNGVNGNQNTGVSFDLSGTAEGTVNVVNNSVGAVGQVGLTFLIDGNTFQQPFSITNDSDPGELLSRFQLDIAPAMRVFNTIAGAPVPFQPAGNTDVTTGLVTVNGTAITPGTDPLEDSMGMVLPGGGIPDGSTLLDLTYNDFDALETFSWDIDVDSFLGADDTITGDELIGSTITVDFSGGQQLSGALFAVPGNPDASTFVATGMTGGAAGITANMGNGVEILLSDSATLHPSTVNQNAITENEGNGVLVSAADTSTLEGITVGNNEISNNMGEGVLVDVSTANAVDTIDVSGNVLNTNMNNGVLVNLTGTTVTDVTVSGNMADANGENGVNFQFDTSTITNVVVDGNMLTNHPNGDGLNSDQTMTDITNYDFTNNTSTDNSGDGADFNLSNSSIANFDGSGNTVTGNGGGGITFETNPSPITGSITNNIITGNTGAGISFTTDGTGGAYTLDFGQDGNPESIADNDISDNGAGILIDLDANVQFFGNVFGNTVNNNMGPGFSLTAHDTMMAFDVRIGAADPDPMTPMVNEAANMFDQNVGAAIAFQLLESTGMPGMSATFDILNNTITRTTDDMDVFTPYAGEGIFVRLTGDNLLTSGAGMLMDSTIDGNTIGSLTDASMGNASHGISVVVNENSMIDNLLIGNTSGGDNDDGNMIGNNGGHGISFLRQDDADVDMLRIIDNVIAMHAAGNGINLVAQNGTADIIDADINDNEITNNVIGVHLRAEADARLDADMMNNFIDSNTSDGIRTTTAATDPTDDRAVGGTWDMNTVTNNLEHGINVAGVGGGSVPLTILNSMITDNGWDGIEFSAAGGTTTISSNLIAHNGGNIASDLSMTQDGTGIDINESDRGFRTFNILNNVITENLGDGIEILSGDTGGIEDGVTANIRGNTIDDNNGRGIDLLVTQDASLTATIGNGTMAGINTIRSNGLEGIYFVSSADPTQGQQATADVALNAGGATNFIDQALAASIDINMNVITGNGEINDMNGTGLNGNGVVLRIGTSQSGNDPDPNDGENAEATSPIRARVIDTDFSGNFGVDVLIESFVSTGDPGTGTTWDDMTFDATGYQPDPLARLDFAFTGNTGDSLDVVRGPQTPGGGAGAFYTGADATFKNRDNMQTDAGPFPVGSNSRRRNAQRFTSDNAPYNVPGTPVATDAVGFDYPGVGTSSFRIESNWSTAGFGGDNFNSTEPFPPVVVSGELDFRWDTSIAPSTFW